MERGKEGNGQVEGMKKTGGGKEERMGKMDRKMEEEMEEGKGREKGGRKKGNQPIRQLRSCYLNNHEIPCFTFQIHEYFKHTMFQLAVAV